MKKYLFVLGRNIGLSVEEIFSYLKRMEIDFKHFSVKKNTLLIELKENLNTKKVIKSLGGTVAIGKSLFEGDKESIKENIKKEWIYFGKRLKMTYSLLNFSNTNITDIKNIISKKFKNQKLKAIYRPIRNRIDIQGGGKGLGDPNKMYNLDNIYFLLKDQKDLLFGLIGETYNSKEVEKRDMKKPVRRSKLAISPRLAKILINLSEAKNTLLDPFCGVGVILQEALMQEINVIGIDIDENAINGCKKNLKWLKSEYKIRPNFKLHLNDSTKIKLNENIDSIATEPELSVLLTKPQDFIKTKKIINKFENLIIKSINNLKPSIKKNIVFTSPLIKTNKKRVGCDFKKIAEETKMKIKKGTHFSFPIKEFRQNKIMNREICVLVK